MKDQELEIGKVYYFDESRKVKGVFVFREHDEISSSNYFAAIGDSGNYIKSCKYKGLIGFLSDCNFIEYKV